MSDSQRLIAKYITKLSLPISTLYQLHLLKIENDESALCVLKEDLFKIYAETGNHSLKSALDVALSKSPIPIRFGEHDPNSKYRDSDDNGDYGFDDASQKAFNCFKRLYLEDSLKYFKKTIENNKARKMTHIEKYYKERCEANIVLGNYHQALRLAEKAKYLDISFVSAICVGDLNLAKKYIPSLVKRISSTDQDKKTVIVTTYELIHLIIYVLFATSTSAETQEISNRLFNSTFLELTELRSLTDLFCNCQYTEFLNHIPDLLKMFDYSLYASISSRIFITSIKQNIIVLHLFPLASAAIPAIAEQFNFSQEDIIYFTKKSIRERKLDGKLDLVNLVYCGSQRQNDNSKLADDIYESTVDIHKKLEISIWVNEYNRHPVNNLK